MKSHTETFHSPHFHSNTLMEVHMGEGIDVSEKLSQRQPWLDIMGLNLESTYPMKWLTDSLRDEY